MHIIKVMYDVGNKQTCRQHEENWHHGVSKGYIQAW